MSTPRSSAYGSLRDRLLERRHLSEGGCWEWTGLLNDSGYGLLVFMSKNHRVHRVMYELHHGPIPAGQDVCHRCDNPPCFNPAHLFLGSQADNAQDMASKGRQWQQAHPDRRMRGEANGRVKLTDEQVAELRHLYESGIYRNKSSLARKFGIGRSQVGRLLRGEQRHV